MTIIALGLVLGVIGFQFRKLTPKKPPATQPTVHTASSGATLDRSLDRSK